MRALVSIHDLMPETMPQVEKILQWLETKDVPPVTLLVVPGKDWKPIQLERLGELAAKGHPLAAHGWHHHTLPRRWQHRLHARFISRNVAEHLDLDSLDIFSLLERSRLWFIENYLPIPELYVPPAWALGPISKADLAKSKFKQIEVTRGIIAPSSAALVKLPLTGFEADTTLRASFLKVWNFSQLQLARWQKKPLRISIHPQDLDLRMRIQMETLFDQPWNYLHYSEV